ncbi:MAG: tRNA (adenosine(37)-N6)-dimethylallyltransferase MiaA [Clostridia bacterium]|nr:tRNA (adenosine(37)-N6)-dimethylallyltransferase MiaA [Clostridia bacterium]
MSETVWILTGPTASGKTDLSLDLAERYGCEIVCMDSMQIYRGMDIGTAKPTAAEQARAPHHMLDICDPRDAYSVAQWVEDACACIRDIQARGKRALLVGGTGFYLRALRHPMAMGSVPAVPEIRAELEAVAAQPDGKEVLHRQLEAADPITARRLHVNDVRRVIRALEVFRATGVPFSRQPQSEEAPPFESRCAALTMPRDRLYARIDLRVERMLEAGLADEVRSLLESGVPEDCQSMKGLGYKELVPYLRGESTLEEAKAAIQQGSRHYAKRQLTWFRAEKDLFWAESGAEIEAFFAGRIGG